MFKAKNSCRTCFKIRIRIYIYIHLCCFFSIRSSSRAKPRQKEQAKARNVLFALLMASRSSGETGFYIISLSLSGTARFIARIYHDAQRITHTGGRWIKCALPDNYPLRIHLQLVNTLPLITTKTAPARKNTRERETSFDVLCLRKGGGLKRIKRR